MVSNNIDINVVVNGEDQLKNLSVALRRIVLNTQDTVKVTTALDARQRALNAALGHTGRSFNDHAKNLRQATANQAALGEEIRRTTADLKKLQQSVKTSATSKVVTQKDIADLQRYSKTLQSIKARALVSDLRSVGQEMKRLGKDAQFVGRSLIIGLTTPIVAFGRLGIQNLYAVDKQLTRLKKLLGETAGEAANLNSKTNQLKRSATDLSYEFGISRELMVGVSGDFAELGINAVDTIGKLTRLTATFSVLGDMDVSSAQQLTQTLYLGSLRALQMTNRMNEFTTAAEAQAYAVKNATAQMYMFNAIENATALSMREIAETLPEISAAGMAFGLNFNEMVSILAPMKAVGIDVNSAATGIKVSFQKLVNPTQKMQKELNRLSDEAKALGKIDIADDFLGVQGIGMDAIQSLVNVTLDLKKNASDEDVLKFYSQLFDDRQATRMLIAMEDLGAFQEAFFRKVKDAEGNLVLSGEAKFIEQINNSLAGTGMLVKDVQSLSEVTQLANISFQQLGDSQSMFVESLNREVTRAEIEAAKKARADLAEYIKQQSKDGINVIEEITSEAGKTLAVNFAGAASAMDIANRELDAAKKSTATSIDRIKIAFKNLSTALIEDLGPTIKDIADKFQAFTERIANMSPETKKMILAVLALMASLGPLVFIFGQARLAAGVMLESILKLVPGLKNLTTAQIAASGKLMHLRTGLTMTGDTIVNTNSRFATFIATLASGNGPVAKMATRFGELTGILRTTRTASDDVAKAVSQISPQGITASKFLGAAPGGATVHTPTTSILAKKTAQNMRAMGITPAEIASVQGVRFNPNLNRFQTAGGQIASQQQAQTMARIHQARMAAETQYRSEIARTAKDRLKDPFYSAKGITSEDGKKFYKGQRISTASADRVARGGIAGATERGRLATSRFMGGVRQLPGQAKEFSTGPLKNYRNSVNAAKGAINDLVVKNSLLGKESTSAFAKGRVGMMGFARSVLSGSKAFHILKIAMISTGIGALVIGIAAAIAIVVKNFDKIRTAAAPGIEALKNAFKTLLDIGKALLAPFLDLFAALGGSDKGASKANDIASAFNKIAKFVEKAAAVVQEFVNKYVVPLLYKGLSMIMGVIKGIVKFIQGVVKLKDNWKEGLKMMLDGLKKIGGAILRFFVGTVLRGLVMGAFQVVRLIVMAFTNLGKGVVNIFREMAKVNINIIFGIAEAGVSVVQFIVDAFALLPRGIGNGIEAAANIFADFIDGIVDAVRGTPLIGWLADQAGLVGAARSGANTIRDIGKTIGEAGRDVADFVSGLTDPLTGLVQSGKNAALGLVDGAADAINSFLDSIPDAIEDTGDWVAGLLEGFGQGGDQIGRGAGEEFLGGVTEEVEDGLDDGALEDPMVDAGSDAGSAAGEAAGENFLQKIGEIIQDLQQKFVDLVLDSVKGALDEATDQLQEALEKQKEEALKVYDTQLKTIEALEKAEESLTREKEYQANRRRMIDERELQRANYQRNRALAIYEGRIDDARVLSLEDEKNQKDFQENLVKTDEDRRKDLVKENLDYLKESIKNAQEETEKMLDEQIKAFQNAAKEITKFPPVTIEEYSAQLNQLNDAAKKIAGENGDILQKMMTQMKDKLKMPNENVGVFATGLDDLVRVAQQKYGLTATTADNTIVGATIGMLAGINGQIVGNRSTINASFAGIVDDVFNTASTFSKISTDIIDPALKDIEKIFQEKNPLKIFEQAFKDANQTILDEMRRTVGHVASAVGDIAKHIDEALIKLAIAQEKAKGGLTGGGDTSPGSPSGPGGPNGPGSPSGPPAPNLPNRAALILQAVSQAFSSGIGNMLSIGEKNYLKQFTIDSLTRSYSEAGFGMAHYNTLKKNATTPIGRIALQLWEFASKQLGLPVSGPAAATTVISGIPASIRESTTPSGPAFANVPAFGSNVPAYGSNVPAFGSATPAYGSNVPAFGSNVPAYGSNTPAFNSTTQRWGSSYFGGRIRRAFGGMVVPGFSSQGIPTILHGGEYIVNAKAVKNIGYAALEAMNGMRYASPGKMSAPSTTTVNETQNINIYVDTFVGEQQWFESMMKEYNLKVVPKNQKTAGLENRSISTYSGINRGL